jgi:Putative Ig domain
MTKAVVSNGAGRKIQQLLVTSILFFLTACNIGQKTTELTLQTKPTTVPAGGQVVFTAFIDHNNGQFEGANWSLSCTNGCGALSNQTNQGSQGNGDTATITYTAPSAPPTPNTITITATSVENPNSSDSDTFTITAAALAVQTASLPDDGLGVAYVPTTLQATGGIAPYTWIVTGGNFPAGMSLSSTGTISGTPTAGGNFNFNVQVQDSGGNLASASESITIIASPQVNITTVTVHTDSPDPQFATIVTDDGSQINLWGDKDSNGLPTTVRTVQVQGPSGNSATFNFDTNGNLVQWGTGSGTVFSLDWQSSTVANFVAYTADGTAIVGPTQITFPSTATYALRRIRAGRIRPNVLDPVALNTFEVQVNRCGKPVVDASVELSVQSALMPSPQFVTAPLPSDGTYEMDVPVLISNSVVATATDLCDYTATVLAPISKAQTIIATGCMIATTATVIASDGLALPAEAAIDAECVAAAGLWYEVTAVMNAVSPSPTSLLQNFCTNGIPAVVHAINSSTVNITVTASVPGNPAQTVGPTSYSGTGPFPGTGIVPPIVMNFDLGGVCDIAGNWSGGWTRVGQSGRVHSGALSAGITNTSTPDSYDVSLAVTDSSGTNNYTFSGEQTSESDLGFTFGFGPATIDGVTGTAVGFLTPDGRAMSGYYAGQAPGSSGGWSLIKQ